MSTAVHEAAHCVIGAYYGSRVTYATIYPTEKTLAETHLVPPNKSADAACVWLAGWAAERHYSFTSRRFGEIEHGHNHSHDASDREKFEDLLLRVPSWLDQTRLEVRVSGLLIKVPEIDRGIYLISESLLAYGSLYEMHLNRLLKEAGLCVRK